MRNIRIWLVAVFMGLCGTASAQDIMNYSTPDKVSQQMYLKGIPVEAILTATVQNIINKAPKNVLNAASSCIKKHMNLHSTSEVVRVMMAAHPGALSVGSQAKLHETSEGQKVLFFCGEELDRASPVVTKELQNTMSRYIHLAFATQSGQYRN